MGYLDYWKNKPKRKQYVLGYQREYARKKRNEFFAHKRCEKCGSKKELKIVGLYTLKGHGFAYILSNPHKNHFFQILCANCYYPYRHSPRTRHTEADRQRRQKKYKHLKKKLHDIIVKQGYPFKISLDD